MKKFLLIITGCLFIVFAAQTQSISYDAASIPAALKKDANVVKRYENILFEVTDIDRASLKVHQVLTILNKDGDDALRFNEYTTKFESLDNAEIKVYDAGGKQINRYRLKDMQTVASGEGLIEDGRITYFNVPASTYPVTVEYKYETRRKGTLFYPTYYILFPGQSVEKSSYTARIPRSLDLRYKEKNITLKHEQGEEANYKWYSWTVINHPTVLYEENSVRSYPYIMMAPNHFKFDEYEGDLSSWKSFGLWYSKLYKGLDVLPPDRVVFFQNMVKDVQDDTEKIRRIYYYLQENFRYVSIQLGIGGLRPFSATFTDQKKYGDCKGLSNYMKAALQAVGIKSYNAVINAGANALPMDEDFPTKFSNHVILCVPLKNDTIWLECTSNTSDFGILGSFTENRNALLITENGGILIPTPISKSTDNKIMVTTAVTLFENASGKTATNFRTTGQYKENMNAILNAKRDDQKESIVYNMGFKQPDEFAFANKEDPGEMVTTLEMNIEKIPEFIAGNKMFFSPRLYKLWSARLPKSENRKLDFYFIYPFEMADTTIIKLPDGFTIDALPQAKQLACKYATYTTKYWYNEKQKAIYSSASLQLNQHKIPASEYAEVKKFFDDVLMDDAQRIVIKKQ